MWSRVACSLGRIIVVRTNELSCLVREAGNVEDSALTKRHHVPLQIQAAPGLMGEFSGRN